MNLTVNLLRVIQTYDESYRRGYDDVWFRGEHFSSNSAAASSSAAA